MALSKKSAKKASAVLRKHLKTDKAVIALVEELFDAAKSSSFRRSLRRIRKALEPRVPRSMKKAA